MRCPFCSHEDTQVVETRESDEGDVVRRRRRCQSCDKRFTTYERIDLKMPHIVKRNGNRTEFDHAKLAGSMKLALRKRPVTIEAIDAAVDRIEARLLAMRDLAVSSGAACSSTDPSPSHVLLALGLSEDLARSTLRFGLGRFNTAAEVEIAAETVAAAVERLRGLR